MHRAISLSLLMIGSVVSIAGGQDLSTAVQTNEGGAVTNVVFRVWAPNATAVHLAGDFNGWGTNSNALAKDTGSPWNGVWSGSVSSARPGHAYKYAITTSNGTVLWKKDPRARQVRTLTGGVPSYVTNGSSQQASVVYNANAFDWTGDTFIPPRPEDVVMYEMHVGTFYDPTPFDGQPATFDDAIQKLDYLKGLGINMIALMPVQEFNGRHSWGYNPSDPFAIEETYGGPDAFKRFVKAAHQKGMAVQVDVVHNHYGDLAANTNAWTSLKTSDLENFDGGEPYFYNAADETGPTGRPGISKTKWGPRPRYTNANVQTYILDNIKMYLDEYKVWALRWDSPRNITGYQANPGAVVGDPDTLIPEAVAMMTNIHAEIRSSHRTNSDRYYSIAEDANSLGGYHAHWEISYHDAIFSRLLATNAPLPPPFNLKYTNGPASMDTIKFRVENKEDPGFRVTFLENHDKCGDHNSATDGKRLAYDFDTNNPTSLTAKRKTLMAGAATLASAGTPMLWMGQEQLAGGDFNDKSALDWNRAAQFAGIVRFHRDMIHLRTNLPALRTASTNISQTNFASVVPTNQTDGLLVFRRQDGVSSMNDVLVAMNFSDSTSSLPSNARAGGFTNVVLNSHTTNYDAGFTNFGPAAGSVAIASSNVTMGPWSVMVFAKTNVPLPAVDANSNGIDDGIDLLTGGRAALAGTFNNWDTNSLIMKWDSNRRVYWFVSRFLAPGTNEFRGFTTNWAPGTNAAFVNNPPSAWHIVFNPSNSSYAITNLGAATNTPPADWKLFWFGSTNVADGEDNDGDGWSNLQEFRRASDPTLHEESRLAVVGGFNGWTWSQATNLAGAAQMRYVGHGLWKYHGWFPTWSVDLSFKVSQGPTENDPNWGPATSSASGLAAYKGSNNFLWLNLPETWQVLTFNERTAAYSIGSLGINAPDSDGDTMPDEWELFCGLNPFAFDVSSDADGDTVKDRAEFLRGSRADDPSDHFARMWMPGGEDWDFTLRREMVWNTETARWEFVFYSQPTQFQAKFAADSGYLSSWGWPASGATAGRSVRNPGTNIVVTVPSAGHHIVRFDEISGQYSLAAISPTDSDGDAMPDEWERFHGLDPGSALDAGSDIDGDLVWNRFEYQRGSHPRVQDRNAKMSLPGSLPLFVGDTSDPWTPTNLRRDMRWNPSIARWEALVFSPGGSALKFKFAAGDWSNGTWGWNASPVPGKTVKWPPTGAPDSGNISNALPARGFYVVRFEEHQGLYSVDPLVTSDTNLNELPDEWERLAGVTDASADTDGDAWINRSEYHRGTDPMKNDAGAPPKRMTVTGNNNAFTVPHWQPAVNNMTWSDQRLRWEWSGTFGFPATVEFKFSQATNTDWTGGKSWGSGPMPGMAVEGAGGNLSQTVVGGSKYLVHFDDTTGAYDVVTQPVWLDWLKSNNLDTSTPRNPWPLDTDYDGVANFLEYALGGNPNARDRAAVPVSVTTNIGGTNNRLVLRWLERTNGDTTLSFVPQMTSGLTETNSWSPVVSSNSADTSGVPAHHRRKEASVPMEGGARFLRLKVTGP